MCARVEVSSPKTIAAFARKMGIQLELDSPPRYNIAPQSMLPALWLESSGIGGQMKWGLTPHFWQPGTKPHPLHNARAETIWSRSNFKSLITQHRCVVMVNGFYEWDRSGKVKQPYWIGHQNSAMPLCLAGIWQMSEQGERECAVITTSPNQKIAPVHDRMPVILDRPDIKPWLETNNRKAVNALMKPCPSNWLNMYPVSTYVNSTRNDGYRCNQRVDL